MRDPDRNLQIPITHQVQRHFTYNDTEQEDPCRKTHLEQQAPLPKGPLLNPARIFSDWRAQTFFRKYFIVCTNPSASPTFGSHFKYFRAREISGRRCFGSSCGNGLKMILLLDSVA